MGVTFIKLTRLSFKSASNWNTDGRQPDTYKITETDVILNADEIYCFINSNFDDDTPCTELFFKNDPQSAFCVSETIEEIFEMLGNA